MWNELEQEAEELESEWKDVIVIEVKKQIPSSWGDWWSILLESCLAGSREGVGVERRISVALGYIGVVVGVALGRPIDAVVGGINGLWVGKGRILLDHADTKKELEELKQESGKVEDGVIFKFDATEGKQDLENLDNKWNIIENYGMNMSQEELINYLTTIIEKSENLAKDFEEIWMKKVDIQIHAT